MRSYEEIKSKVKELQDEVDELFPKMMKDQAEYGFKYSSKSTLLHALKWTVGDIDKLYTKD